MKKTILAKLLEKNEMSGNEKTLDIIFGRWKSQILYAGVKLGVFDCVNSVPKNASDQLWRCAAPQLIGLTYLL